MGWNSRDGAWFCIYCKDSVGFAIELDVGYERKEGSRMTGFYPQQLEGRKNTGVADRQKSMCFFWTRFETDLQIEMSGSWMHKEFGKGDSLRNINLVM